MTPLCNPHPLLLPQVLPVALCFYRHGLHSVGKDSILPSDAPVHICIAWAVGALMSFLSDTYRR